jgi:hypothetical protein
MLGVTVTLVLIIFFVSKASPPRWLLRGYRHVKWESLYEIDKDDPKRHTFRIKVLIEAIQSGVHVFEDTYQWTGRGKEGIPEIISPGHSLMGSVIQRSGWKYYYINLGRDLNIGDRTEVELFHDLYDSENEFQPFLGKIVSQPLDYLLLRVIVPTKNLPSNIHFTEYNTVGPASIVINNTSGTINNQSGEMRWEIQSPIFGHRYEISWS